MQSDEYQIGIFKKIHITFVIVGIDKYLELTFLRYLRMHFRQ